MSWRNDLRKLQALSWPERGMLLEAALLLCLSRAAVLLFSFRRMAGWLGLVAQNAECEAGPLQIRRAGEVAWATRLVAARLPRISTCLVQTLAAAAMLRRRRIPGTVCLGVAKGAAEIVAHAWLRCGGVIVTGSAGRDRFVQISAFRLRCAETRLAEIRR